MKDTFAESTVMTAHGKFVMRAYKDERGQETVVLYTPKFEPKKLPLVRVHSACLTSETFASLQCDCRQQLERALKAIRRDGNGALVYLRQEGRGIGLFDKIRAYHLQEEGLDTYEANERLGHAADERTYEKAKMALDDLGVTRVRLMTNSPEKVAQIVKLGIGVDKQVPIVVRPNRYNARYLATKAARDGKR